MSFLKVWVEEFAFNGNRNVRFTLNQLFSNGGHLAHYGKNFLFLGEKTVSEKP